MLHSVGSSGSINSHISCANLARMNLCSNTTITALDLKQSKVVFKLHPDYKYASLTS